MRRISLGIMVLMVGLAQAQVSMDLKMLSDSLLEKNYSIRLVRMQEDLSGVRNGPGAAGGMPSLGLNSGFQQSVLNTRQEFYNGDVREAKGAANQSASAGIRLDWTLFQGFYVLSTKEQLRLLEEQAALNTALEIENRHYDLAMLYFEIIARKQMLQAYDSALKLSAERHDLAAKKMRIGAGDRLEYLQSLIDLNADSAAWIREKNLIETRTLSLKALCGFSPDKSLILPDSFTMGPDLLIEAVLRAAEEQNPGLRLARQNERLAVNEIKRQQSQRYPSLGLFGEYNFVQSKSAVGILQSNRSIGPSAGVSLQYNLFSGYAVKRSIQEAKVQKEIASLQRESESYSLSMEVYRLFEQYLMQKTLVSLEAENVLNTRENLTLASLQLRSGKIDAFRFREVQLSATEAEARYIDALFALKLAELELNRVSGNLLQFSRAGS